MRKIIIITILLHLKNSLFQNKNHKSCISIKDKTECNKTENCIQTIIQTRKVYYKKYKMKKCLEIDYLIGSIKLDLFPDQFNNKKIEDLAKLAEIEYKLDFKKKGNIVFVIKKLITLGKVSIFKSITYDEGEKDFDAEN